MTTIYMSKQDDMLDAICWHHYGSRPGSVEQVLEANPGLAAQGTRLPIGVRIRLPVLASAVSVERIPLWD